MTTAAIEAVLASVKVMYEAVMDETRSPLDRIVNGDSLKRRLAALELLLEDDALANGATKAEIRELYARVKAGA
jgi:hypothetical protein